ncbi:MAG: tetratricopeptide repeat protein [Verrucomicrobia bacterium]|nr:tetratricopeptide repeat protein [Verrucomicrobiota bacterium]
MFRLFVFLLLLLAAEPAHSQTWLQRYLRERKTKEKAEAPQQEIPAPQPEGIPEEVRRAEPVNDPAPVEPGIPIPTPEPVVKAEPVAAPTPIPVRRAELADPSADPTPLPVRRAEPVDVSFDSVLVHRAEPVEPAAPTPPVSTPQPVGTPRVIVAPTPTPTPVVQVEVAAIPSPSPSPTPTAPVAAPTPEGMDPHTNIVRIAPSNTPLPPETSQLNYANNFYSNKQYDRAATEYERYVTLYPTGPDRDAALFRMAESHRQIQNLNAARRAYEALLMEFPEGEFVGPAAYRMADLCFQEKNYPDALAYYRKAAVRVKDPAISLSAKYYAARCLEALRATSEAIFAYEEVITAGESPFRDTSHLAIAKLLADSGRRNEAITQFDALIQQTRNAALKAETTVRKGLLLMEMGKPERAAAALTAALALPELGSWKETAAVSLFRILYNSQNYPQVVAAYDVSDKQFSAEAQPEVLLIVANSHRQLGKEKTACALYEQIARDFPASAYAKDAQYYRLLALYNANAPGLLEQVDAYLAQNPEANDKRDQLTLLKAETFYKAKQYAAAAPLYASVESSGLASTLKAEALFKLGWCYTQVQPRDNPAAIQAFSAFINQYPVHKLAPTALAQRALSYQQTALTQPSGSPQQNLSLKAALADFDHLLSRYPQASKERELAFQQKALILGAKEDSYPAMAETFARLLSEFPGSPRAGQANYWIGWAAFEAKNYKKAIPALMAARKLDKEHFGDKAARLLLQSHYLLEDRAATAAEADKTARVSAEILRWLGSEFFKVGDAVQAEKYLARLTTQESGAVLQPEDWLILGSVRTKLGKWTEAETTLQTYLEKVSEPSQKATGHLALGEAQLAAKQLPEAQKSADAALGLQPEGRLNAQGRKLSGEIAMARGDYAGAAKLFLTITVLFGDDPEITPKAYAQAYIAYKKAGETAQAAKTLNELQSRYPEYPVP